MTPAEISAMDNDALDRFIAEREGWHIKQTSNGKWGLVKPSGTFAGISRLQYLAWKYMPHYTASLDATAAACEARGLRWGKYWYGMECRFFVAMRDMDMHNGYFVVLQENHTDARAFAECYALALNELEDAPMLKRLPEPTIAIPMPLVKPPKTVQPMAKPLRMWAVYSPSHGLFYNSVAKTRKEAISNCFSGGRFEWQKYRRKIGYRCVRVVVQVEGEA